MDSDAGRARILWRHRRNVGSQRSWLRGARHQLGLGVLIFATGMAKTMHRFLQPCRLINRSTPQPFSLRVDCCNRTSICSQQGSWFQRRVNEPVLKRRPMAMLIRTLLIWLLVLAVPAQGAAAATMASCGPNHHSGLVATLMEPAGPADHAHHDGIAATDHEHPPTAALADEDSSAAAVSVGSAKGSDASKHKCSTCASCCSASAILSSVLTVPAPVLTPTVFSAVVPRVDTLAADGPDRPPRIVLAWRDRRVH